MIEQFPSEPASDSLLQQVRQLRLGLLKLHKVLLEMERATYERVYGRVSSGRMFQLVIEDRQFAWLHAISELIVSVDELLDADEPAKRSDAEALIEQTRVLLRPENGGEFTRKYYAALQDEPAAVLAHREVKRNL